MNVQSLFLSCVNCDGVDPYSYPVINIEFRGLRVVDIIFYRTQQSGLLYSWTVITGIIGTVITPIGSTALNYISTEDIHLSILW